ncbi:hypothetical protein HanPSC8_Chr17g0778581 [Helianthus annuus]|nr:hypothetical protein HanPSC8_Chr17g0778581 [Helianthus annuus]
MLLYPTKSPTRFTRRKLSCDVAVPLLGPITTSCLVFNHVLTLIRMLNPTECWLIPHTWNLVARKTEAVGSVHLSFPHIID